ncbi:hypothetical protein B0H19DRAFT_1383610 [Mycena capillaripes]|nr:hypothetical protein B0H19DRAFT_1383610 [Mycena capillaripes]
MAPGKPGISGQTSPFIGAGGAPIHGVARGSVVLPPEGVGILQRLDAAREKRNQKRAERREKGDKEVSEDEPDELAPFLAGPEALEIPPSSKQLLFEDAVAEKNSFQAHDNSIPDAVFSLAKNGISPPLTLFLPRSLERIRSGSVKTVKHGTGETTKVTVIDVSEFPDEETLDQATFLTCYNTFLTFLEASAGARIFRGFAEHYNRILIDPDLSTWFAAYQMFDKKIRAQFFTKPYIVDVEDSQYRDALQSAKNLILMSSYDQDSDSDSSSFGVGHTPCFAFVADGWVITRLGSETNPSRHGRNFVITATREGLFRIHDNRPVCMRFNCGSCDASGSSHAIHICSLCSDPFHGAVNCTRN